jgi:hypothetical protein
MALTPFTIHHPPPVTQISDIDDSFIEGDYSISWWAII